MIATTINNAVWMFYVQHLVVENIFDEPFMDFMRVKRLADDDGLMLGIIMPEYAARAPLRPRQSRLFKTVVEVFAIQAVEHLVQVVDAPARRRDYFSSMTPARNVPSTQDLRRAGIIPE